MILSAFFGLTLLWGVSSKNEAVLSKPASDVKVIVIGGGVAGLTVASKLHNAGINVTLFEAMDRIGGRTFTLSTGNGQYTEMGAEWIHGEKGNSVFDLVSPLGLLNPSETHEWEIQQGFVLQTGEVLNSTLGTKIQEVFGHIYHDEENWGAEFGRNRSMGEFARFVLNKYNNASHLHSDPTFLEAVYDFAHRATNGGDATDNWFIKSKTDEGEQFVTIEGEDISWRPPYSYSSLHQIILNGNVTTSDSKFQLPLWIKLNTEVTNIKYSTANDSTDMVQVTTADGSQYFADSVVFTPSLGVLKANHAKLFTPKLSKKKQKAIENIGFGSVTKFGLEFEKPWWPPGWAGIFPLWTDHNYTNTSLEYWRENITKEELLQEYDGVALWCRSIASFFPTESAPNLLRIWVSGVPSKILDELDPIYLQKEVMKVFHLFLDKTLPNITNPVQSYQSKWWSNPYTRGTYSYRSLASETNQVWPSDLAKPILHKGNGKPILCFAGEATHSTQFATVNGALDTGVREFNRLMHYYSSSHHTNGTKKPSI